MLLVFSYSLEHFTFFVSFYHLRDKIQLNFYLLSLVLEFLKVLAIIKTQVDSRTEVLLTQ